MRTAQWFLATFTGLPEQKSRVAGPDSPPLHSSPPPVEFTSPARPKSIAMPASQGGIAKASSCRTGPVATTMISGEKKKKKT